MDNLTRSELQDDLTTVTNTLRMSLPVIVIQAAQDECWPDSLLIDVARDVAESVARLHEAAALLAQS